MSILHKIKTTSFSNSEKQIANYILEHQEEIATLSINDLAKATYSSNASIIRFCKRIGIDGYKDFRLTFVQELEKARHQQSYVDFNYPIDSTDSAQTIAHKMANLTQATIDHCYQELDRHALERMTALLDEAHLIYFYSIGDSEIRGQSFANKMIKLGKHMLDVNYLSDPLPYAKYASKDDCALFISYSGEGFEEYLSILKKKHTKILAITAHRNSKLMDYADEYILIEDLERSSDSIGTFYSQIAFDYILNTLYAMIYSKHYAKNHHNKNTIITHKS